MAWITLTPDDINGLATSEREKLAALAPNGDHTLGNLIDQVVREVRGFVGTAVPLGQKGSIPDELKDAAVSLVIWRYVTSTLSRAMVTEARKDAATQALTLLRDVAAKRFLVVPPVVAAPQQTARPSMETIQAGNSGNDRAALSGL